MRPLHLKVKSFTSFRDEMRSTSKDLDLFAIVGPTGSGKSSLLDAMTYALFGTVERVGKQVRPAGQPGPDTHGGHARLRGGGAPVPGHAIDARGIRGDDDTGGALERDANSSQAGEGADKVRRRRTR